MPETWTTRRLLGWTADYFARKDVESPRLAAEVLLAHGLGCDRVRLYMDFDRPLDLAELARYRDMVRRRAAGEPTQYVVGERDFYGRRFAVDRRAFIPRPETELLVEACLDAMPEGTPGRTLDLCTGTGCVAVTLAAERPLSRVVAVDLDPGALELCRANSVVHGVADRVEARQGDLFGAVAGEAAFDVVCANPPYIRAGEVDSLRAEIREHEPRVALDGGPDGLDVVRRIVAGGRDHLAPGGLLALEIGDRHAAAVRSLLEAAGYSGVAVARDHAGCDRIATARGP